MKIHSLAKGIHVFYFMDTSIYKSSYYLTHEINVVLLWFINVTRFLKWSPLSPLALLSVLFCYLNDKIGKIDATVVSSSDS